MYYKLVFSTAIKNVNIENMKWLLKNKFPYNKCAKKTIKMWYTKKKN